MADLERLTKAQEFFRALEQSHFDVRGSDFPDELIHALDAYLESAKEPVGEWCYDMEAAPGMLVLDVAYHYAVPTGGQARDVKDGVYNTRYRGEPYWMLADGGTIYAPYAWRRRTKPEPPPLPNPPVSEHGVKG